MVQRAASDARPSPIAGRWYPGSENDLAAIIDGFLANVPETNVPGEIVGLVAPHAGYIYSGRIAACAFRHVKDMSFERVVVISPMHQDYSAPVMTTAHQFYWTPLGAIQVEHDLLASLEKSIPITPVWRDSEHSLEIELPFLQRVLAKPFLLVPLMLRIHDFEMIDMLGAALASLIRGSGARTLLVASSDLSHFYTQVQANRFDQVMLDRIEAFDPQGVMQVEDEGKAFACGRAAISTVLVAARALGADKAQVVGYGTSADASGDTFSVVGYGAAAITKTQ
jgi:AmmeMemoRadiSam system protein B